MDLTPEYVKMAEKAPEIQELRPTSYPDDMGNWFWNKDFQLECPQCKCVGDGKFCGYCGKKLVLIEDGYHSCDDHPSEKQFVWLPTQDRLQAMVPDGSVWFEKLYRFYEWIREPMTPENWQSPCVDFKSMEQLWLAFVMKSRYGKRWTGTEWIPITEKEAS